MEFEYKEKKVKMHIAIEMGDFLTLTNALHDSIEKDRELGHKYTAQEKEKLWQKMGEICEKEIDPEIEKEIKEVCEKETGE